MLQSIAELDEIAGRVFDHRRFVVQPLVPLRREEAVEETVYWEMFHGRALDRTMTRCKRPFHSWNIYRGDADEPLLSIKFDIGERVAHVTRAILCHVHAAVSTSDNTIESAASTRWVRELVGTTKFDERLHEELSWLVFQAVVGTSRLPLTSLESPLPEFTLGQLGYFPDQIDAAVDAKRLEFSLRQGRMDDRPNDTLETLRDVFHGISLSPYTDFVTNTRQYLRLAETSQAISPSQRVGFLAYLLRLQWRHLNAYDLREFHHRGANYPDALLVDEILSELLAAAAEAPVLFDNSLVRRGLRLGWLLRIIYRGHLVPAQPTSPGENVRVLPAPFTRVDAAEIDHRHLRSRRLFEQEIPMPSGARNVLDRCLDELSLPNELRELGVCLVADRPLGIRKSRLEPDQTPIFSHVVFSRERANHVLSQICDNPALRNLHTASLEQVEDAGEPLPAFLPAGRPGVISLNSILQVASDFRVLATTRGSIADFQKCFDWSAVESDWLAAEKWHIVLPASSASGPQLTVIDRTGNRWLDLHFSGTGGFQHRRGIELPIGGCRAVQVTSGHEMTVFPRN